jgi:hypothetical protein
LESILLPGGGWPHGRVLFVPARVKERWQTRKRPVASGLISLQNLPSGLDTRLEPRGCHHIRADLIDVAARAGRCGRGNLILHLLWYWHRQAEWLSLFEAACGPPGPGAA